MSNLPDWQDDQGMYAWLMAKLDDHLEAEMAEANKNPDHSNVVGVLFARTSRRPHRGVYFKSTPHDV